MDDPDLWSGGGDSMQFRLVYEGPLRSTQRDPEGPQTDPRHEHKHAIRKQFHRQLKHLWAINRNLNGEHTLDALLLESSPEPPLRDAQALAAAHAMYGWNFVPLVTEGMDLSCSLEILFLRRARPGRIIQAGDIDNRLKTLFDALTIPTPHDQYTAKTPEAGESPMYCLLQDDRLITRVTVETDQYLVPPSDSLQLDDVHLVINVEIRPYFQGIGNAHFN